MNHPCLNPYIDLQLFIRTKHEIPKNEVKIKYLLKYLHIKLNCLLIIINKIRTTQLLNLIPSVVD